MSIPSEDEVEAAARWQQRELRRAAEREARRIEAMTPRQHIAEAARLLAEPSSNATTDLLCAVVHAVLAGAKQGRSGNPPMAFE